MRLCGISSRFQLLSPSTRQVTHALLTRPPLTYISLGFNVSPFDLHVLGTPPAFILSQDQTLMLKWCLCPASFIWHCLLLIRVACQSFDQLACSWISLKILEFSGLHYCLFVKDHNLLLRKSSFIRCCCSQRQLWYLIITAFVCQQLFLKSFQVSFELLCCLGAASTTNLSISSPTVLVNTIFRIFCTNYPLLRQFRMNRGFLPCFYSVFYYFTKNGSFCPSCSTRYAR